LQANGWAFYVPLESQLILLVEQVTGIFLIHPNILDYNTSVQVPRIFSGYPKKASLYEYIDQELIKTPPSLKGLTGFDENFTGIYFATQMLA
jgi:hypothetical protein